MTKLDQLLITAGGAASNPFSATHRAIACRDIDRMGEEWTADLSTEHALLVLAISAGVKALAGATSTDARKLIADAIVNQVAAARNQPAVSARRREARPAPRRYWIEGDR